MNKQKRIQKTIESFEKLKEIHQEKIRREKKNYAVVEYWEKQIERFEREIEKRKEQLKKQ